MSVSRSAACALSVSGLGSFVPQARRVKIKSSFYLFRVGSVRRLHPLRCPYQFRNLVVVCYKANPIELDIGLGRCRLSSRRLAVISPRGVIGLASIPGRKKGSISLTVITVSPGFTSSLRVSFGELLGRTLALGETSKVIVSKSRRTLVTGCFRLVTEIIHASGPFGSGALASLISSVVDFITNI